MKDINITSLDHFGRGVGKIDDKIIFVENALPGEIVDINVTKEKKNYIEAEVSNYKTLSKDREEAKCPYYKECGGCNIMHMPYSKQLEFKENKIKEIINKFLNFPISINPIINSEEYYYRNKITLQIKNKIGLYKKKSYDLVNIDNCIITDNRVKEVINRLNDLDLSNIEQIVIRFSDNETMIVISSLKEINFKNFISQLKDVCTSIIVKHKNNYTTIYGNDYIILKLNNYNFKVSAESFFQVNTNQAIKMYDLIKKYAKGSKNVLDLYCGTGSIGIYASDVVENITGIEINKYAIEDAIENAKFNNINNIKFICGDVKNNLKEFKNIDVIIVDPPRSGLDKEAIDNILKLSPNKIVYVSCDPITLSRDLKILSEFYNIEEITPIDMFPNTYHVESVTILNRKRR
ncbi:MAG: 23S rRNA (uracil(1939)-C(5))-methyltransferase RlmD [Bacilli bacterium]|nr:23S rRNA (uracil(1939)-C(5))-methyltransferase RlmD [Bacilli bacterium]